MYLFLFFFSLHGMQEYTFVAENSLTEYNKPKKMIFFIPNTIASIPTLEPQLESPASIDSKLPANFELIRNYLHSTMNNSTRKEYPITIARLNIRSVNKWITLNDLCAISETKAVFRCLLCNGKTGGPFKSSDSCIMHTVKKHLPNPNKYSKKRCFICDRLFNKRATYSWHIKNKHTKEEKNQFITTITQKNNDDFETLPPVRSPIRQ